MSTNTVLLGGDSPESPPKYFKELVGWFDKYTKLRKFFATRGAIKRGEHLFDLSSDALKEHDVMGPLTFNVYQSTLSGAPAVILGAFIGMIFPLDPKPLAFSAGASEFNKAWVTELGKVAPSVTKSIGPFVPPLLLLMSAWAISWGCLKRPDATNLKRQRCRDAFLYYDGTYGLLPQALLAIAVGLGIAAAQRDWLNAPLWVAIGIFAMVGMGFTVFLITHKIPKLLFALNGYDPKIYGFWHRHKPENRAPWARYSFAIFILNGIGSWALVITMFFIQVLLAYAIAYARVWLRLRIQHGI